MLPCYRQRPLPIKSNKQTSRGLYTEKHVSSQSHQSISEDELNYHDIGVSRMATTTRATDTKPSTGDARDAAATPTTRGFPARRRCLSGQRCWTSSTSRTIHPPSALDLFRTCSFSVLVLSVLVVVGVLPCFSGMSSSRPARVIS